MKQSFVQPEIEVIEISENDIIKTSDGNGLDSDEPGDNKVAWGDIF